MTAGYRFGKRLLDVVVAACGLLLLSLVLLAVAATIWLTMGRPVLFRQRRPGRSGRPFELIKFRTMRLADPAADTSEQVRSDGYRLTRLGGWLRRTSLDELPTLWNVVRGDMSLVGPRPLLESYLDRYTPLEARRHDVRPGVTGLAQVRGRNTLDWADRFTYDLYYVEHVNLALDLRIVAETVRMVLRREGINAPGVATSPEFVPRQLHGQTRSGGPPPSPVGRKAGA